MNGFCEKNGIFSKFLGFLREKVYTFILQYGIFSYYFVDLSSLIQKIYSYPIFVSI